MPSSLPAITVRSRCRNSAPPTRSPLGDGWPSRRRRRRATVSSSQASEAEEARLPGARMEATRTQVAGDSQARIKGAGVKEARVVVGETREQDARAVRAVAR